MLHKYANHTKQIQTFSLAQTARLLGERKKPSIYVVLFSIFFVFSEDMFDFFRSGILYVYGTF